MGNQQLKLVGIINHGRHQLPGLFIIVKSKRKFLQVGVKQLARLGDDTPPGHMSHIATQKMQNTPGDVDD